MNKDSGETPQKRISVTIPTNASFKVTNNSTFIGSSLNITNNGEVPVDISVAEFIDPDGDYGIKLITDEDVKENTSRSTYKRNEINLWLENISENKKICLGNRKLYSELNQEIGENESEKKNIAKVLGASTSTINISGKAGTNALDRDEPIRNSFKLILKIKKNTENSTSK